MHDVFHALGGVRELVLAQYVHLRVIDVVELIAAIA